MEYGSTKCDGLRSKFTTCTGYCAILMDEFLDEEIGENSKLLPDLLRGLKKKENYLQGQVNRNKMSIHNQYTCMIELNLICTHLCSTCALPSKLMLFC